MKSKLLFLSILLILTMFAFGQNSGNKYGSEWKQVDKFIDKGLTQSALKEVDGIYQKAKKENQQAQVIKALVHQIQLREMFEEDTDISAIVALKSEIENSPEPARSILNALLADQYLSIYRAKRWVLMDRTLVQGQKSDDINTWTSADFIETISNYYWASIQHETLLKSTPLKPYDAIIEKGNVRKLRPTLYDLLVHKALNFFTNDERTVRVPTYHFELDQTEAFAPAEAFSKVKFETNDSLSLDFKALLLYQKLIEFHLSDRKPSALIDVDLHRLSYVYRKSVHPDKEELYRNALERIIEKYGDQPESAMASYKLAKWYHEKSLTYSPYGDTTFRMAAVKALEVAEPALQKFPKSEGGAELHNLKSEIYRKELKLNIEDVNIPDKPFLLSLNYKNSEAAFFKIVRITPSLKDSMERMGSEKAILFLNDLPVTRAWSIKLPATHDYQNHRVEIKVDSLPPGEYGIFVSTSPEIHNQSTSFTYESFQVSNISFVSQGRDHFVLHRETGKPLKGVVVQVRERIYNNNLKRYVLENKEAYTTDENGRFRLKAPTRWNRFEMEFTLGNDRFVTEAPTYYPNPRIPYPIDTIRMFYFTDRSIYRPGQTVYFKGILLKKRKGENGSQIVEHHSTTVTLYDANGQKVDSLSLQTNDFGTVSGVFHLPTAGLNGEFWLKASNIAGEVRFRVEDYKRPRYRVEMIEPEQVFKVGDTIRLTGMAEAFAGNSIDGATVRYRVERMARFPYSWRFWPGWWPTQAPTQIKFGETVTDSEGKFTIEFTAIPDKSVDPKTDPIFDYQVFVDVTDGAGETRSTRQTVSVGYKGLVLEIDLPDRTDDLSKLKVITRNTNGAFTPANITLNIRKLIPEDRLLRKRVWDRPDQFVMTKEEFIAHFPQDEYDYESHPSTWEKGEALLMGRQISQQDGKWIFPDSARLTPGYYELEFTAVSASGDTIQDKRTVELFEREATQLAKPNYLWTKESQPVEPGETAQIRLGTSAEQIYVIQTLIKLKGNSRDTTRQIFSLNSGIHEFTFAAEEEDRGGFGVSYLFVKDNRVYTFQDVIQVPWSNKQLSLHLATFRDKTLPGSNETWTLKVAGSKGEKVAAELLASMYDASLDEFVKHQWAVPAIWPVFNSHLSWETNQAFRLKNGWWISLNQDVEYRTYRKQYDEIISLSEERNNVLMRMASARIVEEDAYTFTKSEGMAIESEDAMDTSVQETREESVVQPTRKDFRETAFFFPDLRTQADGSLEFSFTMPEALTKWKFQALGHTKDLAFGYESQEVITQKELMVQPNIPRFLRQSDQISISSKVVNLSDRTLSGSVTLSILDASNGQLLNTDFQVEKTPTRFTLEPGQSGSFRFPIVVPADFTEPIMVRVIAEADAFSDGEENMIPVLSNRMLVTETLPLTMKGTGSKRFEFDKLSQSNLGDTRVHHALTVTYTGNPAWYVIQALPYLIEYPYDCAEQVWNRYFANALATHIVSSSPRIEQIFKSWRDIDPSALLSNLQKNQELKTLLLEETPWVLDAKSEAEQKRNLALLLDLVTMKNAGLGNLAKLEDLQRPEGAFPWFKDGPVDEFVTYYILSGMGRLLGLTTPDKAQVKKMNNIILNGLQYVDRQVAQDYEDLLKRKTLDLNKYTLSPIEIFQLYTRSFFPQQAYSEESKKAYRFYLSRLPNSWVEQTKYVQAMAALVFYRAGDKKSAESVLASLRETAIHDPEKGTYWKTIKRSWWWQEAPIEQHALIVEAFDEIANDQQMVDQIRTWLLTQKRTHNWESTKATADACYALLLRGTDWLHDNPKALIHLGDHTLDADEAAEAGTGYFKTSIAGSDVRPEMGHIEVEISGSDAVQARPSWGGVYWQYFEDLDKITFSETPLKLQKQLFITRNSDRGPVLTALTDDNEVKVGDKLTVRIILTVDRDMEYVHMKDMRGSGLEPTNVISSYKWQGNLSYYETTRDAATHFFFNYLPQGTHVFEYPIVATHEGDFSNGVTTIQCMYAPEFMAHTEGIRLNVK